MSNAMVLVKRNVTVFARDRGQVFFSLIAPLILLMLYVLFLGKMQVDSMTASMGGTAETEVEAFVYAWVLAGMVMITTLTTSLSALAAFVDDRVSGRFKEFRVSPMRNTELLIGYMVAGLVISLTLSLVVLVVGALAFGGLYGAWAEPAGYAAAAGYAALLCLVFSALAALAVTFVRSVGALSGLATLLGTLSGFLAFAYIPIGVVSPAVASVLNALPFSPSAMLLRDPLARPALERMLEGVPVAQHASVLEDVRETFGFDLYIGDVHLQPVLVAVALAVLAVAFAALASHRIRALTTSDMR